MKKTTERKNYVNGFISGTKRVALVALGVAFLASCNNGPSKEELTARVDSLNIELNKSNNEVNEFMGLFNEVSEGFRKINEAEDRIAVQSGSLENAVESALCSRHAALQRGAGICDCGGNIELFLVHVVVHFCIRNCTVEELTHRLGSCLRGVHDISQCGLNVLAADHVALDLYLAGGHAEISQSCLCFHFSLPPYLELEVLLPE